MDTIMTMSETVQRQLLEGELEEELVRDISTFISSLDGKAVAVRSSCVGLEDGAGHAFAGQFETVLNLKTVEDVCTAVKTVWASLWAPRILSFLKAGKITDSIVSTMGKAAMAVIIQVQVASRSSGICFSVNPDPSVEIEGILCEAVWGQGQGIVDGSITPDQWIVSRDGKILSETIVEKSEKVELKESGIETVELQEGMFFEGHEQRGREGRGLKF
jgi:pyruvate,water dikinase